MPDNVIFDLVPTHSTDFIDVMRFEIIITCPTDLLLLVAMWSTYCFQTQMLVPLALYSGSVLAGRTGSPKVSREELFRKPELCLSTAVGFVSVLRSLIGDEHSTSSIAFPSSLKLSFGPYRAVYISAAMASSPGRLSLLSHAA